DRASRRTRLSWQLLHRRTQSGATPNPRYAESERAGFRSSPAANLEKISTCPSNPPGGRQPKYPQRKLPSRKLGRVRGEAFMEAFHLPLHAEARQLAKPRRNGSKSCQQGVPWQPSARRLQRL